MQGVKVMQDRKIIIIGVVLAVVLGLLISDYIGLFGEDYGTGLTIDTNTRKYEIYGNYNVKDKKIFYTDPNWEQLDSDVYITSWLPNENSMKIITTAKFYLSGHNGGVAPFSFPDIFFGQYAWVVQYIDTSNRQHTIINGRYNWIDTDYVSIVQGNICGNIPGKNYNSQGGWVEGNIFGENTWFYVPSEGWAWEHIQTPTLSFVIKGNKIGAIKVSCILEYAEMDGNPYLGGKAHAGEILASEDWAYLAPGIGKVDVLGVDSIRQEGTTYTEGTNRVVPLYVFEEGSTVHLSVDTGYAGATTGEKGWRLAIYKPTQTQPLAVWWLEDDLRGYEITWTIPKGTWTPGGLEANRLEVHLTNTVINQAEVTFMIVDNISKIPGKPTIETDKPKYIEGETVTLTLTAEANPITQASIKTFYVEVRYNNPFSADFDKFYVPAHYVGDSTYKGTTTFEAVQSGTLIIYAWSWDVEGRYSDRADKYIEVEQGYGNYEITIIVNETDGTPISDAKITLDGQTKYTSTDGKAVFWLEWGTYPITVEKSGYETYRGHVVVNGDKTVVITLTSLILPPEEGIVYLVIAVAILIAIYAGVKLYKKYKHR